MFCSSTMLAFVLGAISLSVVSTSPVAAKPETLSFKRVHWNPDSTASMHAIIAADLARISHFRDDGAARVAAKEAPSSRKRAAYSFSTTNAVVTYIASVGVGSPATSYNLLIDTGSSNTWVGANKAYLNTSTSVNTGKSVSVTYGSGSFSGTEYTDTVTMSSNLVIKKQSIGVASRSSGFSGVDGILGIGPTVLTDGTVSGVGYVPTVTDNLYSQGKVSLDAVGVYFAPTKNTSTTNGELTFGGADTSKCTGALTYVAITATSPASYYWGINQTVTYNGATLLSNNAGIVDTGTTLIYLATDAYEQYVSATGATLDSATGLLKITSTQLANLKPLNFAINGKTYSLSANAQIWPRTLNANINGAKSGIYLVVSDMGSNSGKGLDFINGYTFLERFYTVYDTTNKRFGIATTAYTNATTN